MASRQTEDKLGKYPTSINFPLDLAEDLDEIRKKKHLNFTSVVHLGLSEWVEMQKNPAALDARIRKVIEDNPDLVKDLVDSQVRKTMREMSEKK